MVNIDPNMSINYFSAINTNLDTVSKRSPSRFMSDLFWKQLNWGELKNELCSINILDLGCGKGGYLKYWNNCSENQIDSYIGFDIKKRIDWEKLESEYPFAKF
ncbi:hypothetical protein, partial [Nodularia spumigena]|uniref:hypothetical protein n=1 Tax=Nodularia spumigena TaxID=70799 RepID=UPI002B21A750